MIAGKSDVYFMIADPIEHTKSPGMFNALFAAEGIDAVMVPVNVEPDALAEAWAGFRALKNLRGLIVSVPFKTRAMQLCDHANLRAARVGTANCVIREPDGSFRCDNFDGAGFVAGLERNNHRIEGRDALLVGAGGAGASIGFCIAEAGARALTIHDVDAARAEALAARIREAFPDCLVAVGAGLPDPAGHDLIVNATPVGMKPDDPIPLAADSLSAGMVVVDIIMQPRETPLLQRARAAGCAVQYGQDMMDCQMELLADFLNVRRSREKNS
jgi:shikimate dehydrogenase